MIVWEISLQIQVQHEIDQKLIIAQSISEFASDELKQRFPDLKVIENFDLIDFVKLKKNKSEDKESIREKLSLLIAHYYPSVSLNNLKLSMPIREGLNLVLELLGNDQILMNWTHIFYANNFWISASLSLLFEYCITVPLSTVTCERGWSSFNKK